MASTTDRAAAPAGGSLASRQTVPVSHPDVALIEQAHSALRWWAQQLPSRPTSSVTGGGAVAAVEESLSQQLGGRRVVALPNATFGLRVALRCAGVTPGDDVLVSGVDWPAATAAVVELGAEPIAVPVSPDSLTIDPGAAARLKTPTTTAVVATHLHGVPADVPALRQAVGGKLAVVEDAAQALGSAFGEDPVGTLGHYAVFSLGPGKTASAGELGLLACADRDGWLRALRASQHPVRQLLGGVVDPREDVFIGRPAPLAALLGAYQLTRWQRQAEVLRRAERPVRHAMYAHGIQVLGRPLQRSQPGHIPVLLPPGQDDRVLGEALADLLTRSDWAGTIRLAWRSSGAKVSQTLTEFDRRRSAALVERVRVIELSVADNLAGPTGRPARRGTRWARRS